MDEVGGGRSTSELRAVAAAAAPPLPDDGDAVLALPAPAATTAATGSASGSAAETTSNEAEAAVDALAGTDGRGLDLKYGTGPASVRGARAAAARQAERKATSFEAGGPRSAASPVLEMFTYTLNGT